MFSATGWLPSHEPRRPNAWLQPVLGFEGQVEQTGQGEDGRGGDDESGVGGEAGLGQVLAVEPGQARPSADRLWSRQPPHRVGHVRLAAPAQPHRRVILRPDSHVPAVSPLLPADRVRARLTAINSSPDADQRGGRSGKVVISRIPAEACSRCCEGLVAAVARRSMPTSGMCPKFAGAASGIR
jgi:hypothetical protein